MRDVCEATGKLQYPNSASAEKSLRLKGHKVRRAYKCAHCNLWHLTSEPKRGNG